MSNVKDRQVKADNIKMLQRKRDVLKKKRNGKLYPLFVWAILFTGIINLFLGEYSNVWSAAKHEVKMYGVDPVGQNLFWKELWVIFNQRSNMSHLIATTRLTSTNSLSFLLMRTKRSTSIYVQ